jgi:hypothetical protein
VWWNPVQIQDLVCTQAQQCPHRKLQLHERLAAKPFEDIIKTAPAAQDTVYHFSGKSPLDCGYIHPLESVIQEDIGISALFHFKQD